MEDASLLEALQNLIVLEGWLEDLVFRDYEAISLTLQ